MSASVIPLFPLHTVLFPGARIPLRIFETRYIDMVRSCLRNDSPFGIVAIRNGHEVGDAVPYQVGTFARIVDWERTDDGLLQVEVLGLERFRFASLSKAADGLYLAHDADVIGETPAPMTAGWDWAVRLLAAMEPRAGRRGGAGPGPDLDDACAVCWNLAIVLPLELEERQALLETESLGERFDSLRVSAQDLFEELDSGRE